MVNKTIRQSVKTLPRLTGETLFASQKQLKVWYRISPGWTGTTILHLVLLVLVLGVPSCSDEREAPTIIPVEMIIPATTPPAPEPPQQVEKPKPPKPKAVPSPVKRIASKPKPPPEPKPEPEKEVVKAKPKTKPEPEPKEEKVAKQEKPQPKQQKNKDEEIDSLLEDFLQKEQASPQPAAGAQGVTDRELMQITTRLAENWIIPAGMANVGDMLATIEFQLGPDGSINGGVTIVERDQYQRDPVFRAYADSVRRAAISAAPFDFLPPGRIRALNPFIIGFTPSDLR